MAVALASDLVTCAGVPLSSSNSPDIAPQVPDHQAMISHFIPADACSALLISPRRVLVTAGTLSDDRVLPFTVLRYFDIDPSPHAAHKWVKPLLLRPAPKRSSKRRRPVDTTFPVCRIDHTLTLVPDVHQLFLLGGIKVGGKDEGTACKSIFFLDLKTRHWESVHTPQLSSRTRSEQEQVLGPCFAHTAVYLHTLRSDSRPRKASGYILVHGGYSATTNPAPRSHLHIYDVRARRWILRTPAAGISAPQRAFHAAAVTDSCRYFILHGGTCSNINEPTFLSSDLYAFDMVTSEWCRPKLLPNSAPPPAARSKHSLVNGIGPHAGKLVMYGGFVGSGESSCDMFTVTIIEPSAPGQPLSVLWEKIDVVTPARALGQPSSSHSSRHRHNDLSNPAVYGGALIPVPVINKYLVIGGRGPYGIRNAPLLLDPNRGEYLDRLAPGLASNAPRNALSVSAPALNMSEGTQHSIPLKLRIKYVTPPYTAEGNVTKQAQGSGISRPQRPPSKLSPPKVSIRPTPVPDVGPNPSSFQASQGGRSASPVESVLASRPATARKANDSYLVQVTSVLPSSVAPIGKTDSLDGCNGIVKTATENHGDEVVPLVENDYIPRSPPTPEAETPPTKRRRFTKSVHRESGKDSIHASENESTPQLPDSGGSDFVAASDFAKRAVSRTAKAVRGRGRGRTLGTNRRKAAIVAEEREAREVQEQKEELHRENARLVESLRVENEELRKAKDVLRKENNDLNEQIKSLLSQVHTLRTSRRVRDGGVNFSQERSIHTLASLGSEDITASGRRSLRPGSSRGGVSRESELQDMIRDLHSKVSDLREECQEVTGERDTACEAQKMMEEGKRALESEFNAFKNRFARLETEKDQLRRHANDLRTTIAAASSTQDSTSDQLRKLERENTVLRRRLETVEYSLRETEQRRMEEILQLSNAQRVANSAKCQLMDAKTKYEEFHSKEKCLQAELISERKQCEDWKRQAELGRKELDKLEERNSNLLAELQVVRSEFDSKLREWDLYLKDMKRARDALNHERGRAAELDLETTRLRRRLERSEKERHLLCESTLKREECLKSLGPSIAHIQQVLGAWTGQVDNEMVKRNEPEVNQDGDKRASQGQVGGRVREGKSSQENNRVRAGGKKKVGTTKRCVISQDGDEVIVESVDDDEDAKSPILPSEGSDLP